MPEGLVPPGLGQAAGQAASKVNPAISNFLKANWKFAYAGGVGLGFLGLDLASIATSNNKLQALLKTLKDFVLIRIALVGTFTAFGAAVRAIVKDTGSLEAALRRLEQIQRQQRIFAPLVGGARAAKQHVADLLAFSAKTPFTFEGVAEAERNLRVMSRGAFAGTGALKTVGDAAAASGNGFAESASAVGSFYDALHNGEPVNQATEQLRQMGLVSDLAATHLEHLSDAGASSMQMADSLTRSLEESRGGMDAYAKTLEGVSAAHDKAVESAKAAFGQKFAEPQVKNIQNWTSVLVSLTPALGSVGKFLGAVTNGFSTIASSAAKAAAQSEVLGNVFKGLAVAVGVLAAGLTLIGVVAIPGAIAAVTALVAPLGALGVILATVFGGAAIAAGVIALVALAAAGYGLYRMSKEASDGLKELNKAHREAQAAINAHAAAIDNLTDLQEAYGRSVQHLIDLQGELNDAIKAQDYRKIAEIKRAITEARVEMGKLPRPGEVASKERGVVMEERQQERLMREEAQFREQLAQHPEHAAALQRQRAEQLEQQAEEGRTGLRARQRAAEGGARYLPQQTALKEEVGRLDQLRKGGQLLSMVDRERYRNAQDQLADIEDKTLTIQQTEGKGQALGIQAQIQRLRHAQRFNQLSIEAAGIADEQDRKDKEREAAREKRLAGGAVAGPRTGREIQALETAQRLKAERETRVTERAEAARGIREELIEATRGREITKVDVQLHSAETIARLTGNVIGRQSAQDMGAFMHKFEEFRRQGFEEPEAKQLALQERANELLDEVPGAIKPIADSLTRIGGGGGVTGPTGDPMVRVQQRIATLAQRSNEYLSIIATNTAKVGTTAPGGKPEELEAAKTAREIRAEAPGAPGTPEEPVEEEPKKIPEIKLSEQPPGSTMIVPGGPLAPGQPEPPKAPAAKPEELTPEQKRSIFPGVSLPAGSVSAPKKTAALTGEDIRKAIGGLPQTAMVAETGTGEATAAAYEAAQKALAPGAEAPAAAPGAPPAAPPAAPGVQVAPAAPAAATAPPAPPVTPIPASHARRSALGYKPQGPGGRPFKDVHVQGAKGVYGDLTMTVGGQGGNVRTAEDKRILELPPEQLKAEREASIAKEKATRKEFMETSPEQRGVRATALLYGTTGPVKPGMAPGWAGEQLYGGEKPGALAETAKAEGRIINPPASIGTTFGTPEAPAEPGRESRVIKGPLGAGSPEAPAEPGLEKRVIKISSLGTDAQKTGFVMRNAGQQQQYHPGVEMLSILKSMNRGIHASTKHLDTIAEKPAGVQ